MSEEPDLRIGFSAVDEQPDAAPLIAAMDATATWPAVRQLRAHERERLALQTGDRLLDVGCGLGEAAVALAPQVGPDGEVVGLDVSDTMLDVARGRAADLGLPIRFRVGDALALDEPSASFDACRSERMLQWVPDMRRAVAEMVRVLRPGGRLSLIDSDWRTLDADLPDAEALRAVIDAMATFRGESASAGGRLLNLCRDEGLTDLDCVAAAHVWTSWDPDAEPSPAGLFPIRIVAPQLVELGLIEPHLAARFVDSLEEAGRRDRLCISLTMLGVTGRRA
jgi:SAM-dependent methyltransferase